MTDVRIEEDSVLSRLADWHAQKSLAPLTAIGDGRVEALFVTNEILLDGDDPNLAEEIAGRYGGELLDDPPLPPQRDDAEPRDVDMSTAPKVVRLRFDRPPPIDTPEAWIEEALARNPEAPDTTVGVSSEFGARVAAVVARHGEDGRVGVNAVGPTSGGVPLSTIREGSDEDPTTWSCFSGPSRIVEAWQLVDSFRQMGGSTKPVILAICDGGFWVDRNGVPLLGPGQTVSDFGPAVPQWNLIFDAWGVQNQNVYGTNPTKCSGGKDCPWHANQVASAAVAAVNNRSGSAGSGGTVARPWFFLTSFTDWQKLRCLKLCVWWGIDVLNMSWSEGTKWEALRSSSTWVATFEWAARNGLVMVAAAGNDGWNLPDQGDHPRPATRTPGVICVGALDADDRTARGNSNHGSSVTLWAPGTNVPIGPDGANLTGSTQGGTSIAAPLVSGVAAMMRACNPRLTADDMKRILVDTAWSGQGRVTRGLDAYAAVSAAISGALPDSAERNDTPATAAPLVAMGQGELGTGLANGGFSSISRGQDVDYWRFDLPVLSTVRLSLDWYEKLARLNVGVVSVDDGGRAVPLTAGGSASSGGLTLDGLLSPGRYAVRVAGGNPTLYRLRFRHRLAALGEDLFEPNDTFDTAVGLRFEAQKGPWTTPLLIRDFGPGTFDATLHLTRGPFRLPTVNPDYFRLDVPERALLRIPTVWVDSVDAPVDVTLYDSNRAVIGSWHRRGEIVIQPPERSTCFLEVTGADQTRYTIRSGCVVEKGLRLGPLEEELSLIPKWWGDPPPTRLTDRISHYALELDPRDGDAVVFETDPALVAVSVLDNAGEILRRAEAVEGGLRLETSDLEPGTYVIAVDVDQDAANGLVPGLRSVPPTR